MSDESRIELPATSDLGGWLDRIAPHLSEALTPVQKKQLLRYAGLLREWNEKINLTAILDDEGIAVRHFLDCLTIIPDIRLQQTAHPMILADVGTGAGFPGLVIKIACPEIEVVLIDSLAKRLKFLDEVISELSLTGVRTVHARAEDAGHHPDLREKCDWVVARAVASLPVLAEYCLPLVRKNGSFLAMKAQADDEILGAQKAIAVLGGGTLKRRTFLLPGTDMTRTVITVPKIRPTPAQYPRKAGKVEQSPLK